MAAIPVVKGDMILIIEDDDLYFPTYTEETIKFFERGDLIGHAEAFLYNIPNKSYYIFPGKQSAALFQTGFAKSVLQFLWDICNSNTTYYIDGLLWKLFAGKKNLVKLPQNLAVGVKGLGGRPGLTRGQGNNLNGLIPDTDSQIFDKWFREFKGEYI